MTMWNWHASRVVCVALLLVSLTGVAVAQSQSDRAPASGPAPALLPPSGASPGQPQTSTSGATPAEAPEIEPPPASMPSATPILKAPPAAGMAPVSLPTDATQSEGAQ